MTRIIDPALAASNNVVRRVVAIGPFQHGCDMPTPITKNNVRVKGQGDRVIVLGHGFATDQRAWRFVAPAFEDHSRVVLFDHLGFGGSDIAAYDPLRHTRLEGFAQDLLDILDTLALREVVYVGHSAAGVIGLLASIAQPHRFSRLVLLGTSPRFVDEPPDYRGGFAAHEIESILDLMDRDQLGFAQTIAPLAMGDQSPPPLVDEFEQGLRRLDPVVARGFGRLAFGVDCRDRLPLVTRPVLVVQCRADSIVPVEVGRYLHAHLAGSRLVELDASGHCPHLSHPQQTLAAIAPFVEGTDA